MTKVKQYAIEHAVTQDTLGTRFDGARDERFTLEYSKDAANAAKVKFIGALKPGDEIFMEAGSGAERFALGCVRAGAEVFRIPTYQVHDELKRRGNGFEPEGDESDEQTEKRKKSKKAQMLSILRDFALTKPEAFYPFREIDQKLAEIAIIADAYDMIQNKIRMPAVQRLRASVADLDIVEPVGKIGIEMDIQEHLAELLFGPMRRIVKETKNKSGEIAKPAHKETFTEVLERSLRAIEERLRRRMVQAFRDNKFWEGMYREIQGCGPVTAAKLIAGIKDIKFFDSRAKLVEAAGYGFLPDGSRKRKVRLSSETGRALKAILQEMFPDWTIKQLNDAIRMNWRPGLKQAVFLFTSQIRGYGQPDNPWKQAYLHRLAYEKALQEQFAPKPDGTTSYPDDRAQRWLGQKFLRHLWSAWRRCEADKEYRPYNFECLRG